MKFEKEYWFVYDNKPAPKIDALIDIKKEFTIRWLYK
jgi:hypothetical protein